MFAVDDGGMMVLSGACEGYVGMFIYQLVSLRCNASLETRSKSRRHLLIEHAFPNLLAFRPARGISGFGTVLETT